MITWISGWFFGPEMAVSWRISVFQKLVCWNPYFYRCALFGPSCQEREILDPHQKRGIWLITEKLIFGYFWLLLLCLGSGEVARRATSLGPKPSLFFWVCFVLFYYFCFPFLLFNNQDLLFPPKRHFCLLVSVSLCFSLVFCFTSLFDSLFLCLSLSLSLVLFFFPSF